MCTGEMPNELSPVKRVERIIPERIERLADGLVQFAELRSNASCAPRAR